MQARSNRGDLHVVVLDVNGARLDNWDWSHKPPTLRAIHQATNNITFPVY